MKIVGIKFSEIVGELCIGFMVGGKVYASRVGDGVYTSGVIFVGMTLGLGVFFGIMVVFSFISEVVITNVGFMVGIRGGL